MTKLARTRAIATMGVVCAAYVAAQTNAYVSSGAPQTVIDTRANAVLRSVQLGISAFSPDGTKAYAIHGPSVSIIDVATETVTSTLALPVVGTVPLAFAANGQTVYAAVPGAVQAISLNTGLVTSSVAIAGNPTSIAVTPDGTRAYVVGGVGSDLSLLPPGPVDPTNGRVYVIDTVSNSVVTSFTPQLPPIPVSPPVQPFNVYSGGTAVWISPNGKWAYVGITGVYDNGTNFVPSGGVAAIDIATNAILQTSVLGGAAGVVSFTADSTRAYVSMPFGWRNNNSGSGASFPGRFVGIFDTTDHNPIGVIDLGAADPNL